MLQHGTVPLLLHHHKLPCHVISVKLLNRQVQFQQHPCPSQPRYRKDWLKECTWLSLIFRFFNLLLIAQLLTMYFIVIWYKLNYKIDLRLSELQLGKLKSVSCSFTQSNYTVDLHLSEFQLTTQFFAGFNRSPCALRAFYWRISKSINSCCNQPIVSCC